MSNAVSTGHQCVCGFSSKTKSGLTNHQKTCDKSETLEKVEPPKTEPVKTQETGMSVSPSVINKKYDYISPTERTQFAKRITERKDAIIDALQNEIHGDSDTIKDVLRRNYGVTMNTKQLNELAEGVDSQIELMVNSSVREEEETIKVEESEIDEQYAKDEKEMKDRHRREFMTLFNAQKEKKNALKIRKKNIRSRIIDEKAGDLLRKKATYQAEILRVREVEQKIEIEASTSANVMRKSKGRMTHIINDSANRALEQLLMVSTREEAAALLKSIPTVSEAIMMCQTAEGFVGFMKSLDPQVGAMALPGPAAMPMSDIDLKLAKEKVIDKMVGGDDDDDDSEGELDERTYEMDDNIVDDRRHYRR